MTTQEITNAIVESTPLYADLARLVADYAETIKYKAGDILQDPITYNFFLITKVNKKSIRMVPLGDNSICFTEHIQLITNDKIYYINPSGIHGTEPKKCSFSVWGEDFIFIKDNKLYGGRITFNENYKYKYNDFNYRIGTDKNGDHIITEKKYNKLKPVKISKEIINNHIYRLKNK